VDRAYRNTPLTPEQKKKNQRSSRTQCTVEHVFGILKLRYSMGQIAEAEALAKKSIDSGYKIRTVSN
jgi:IS5 family transposase